MTVLEYLKQHGGMLNTAQVAQACGISGEDALQRLTELVKEGRVRRNWGRSRWQWDEDFRCSDCRKTFPEVKRYQANPCCGHCFRSRYNNTREALNSRLTSLECGPTWDGRMAQQWLGRRLYA